MRAPLPGILEYCDSQLRRVAALHCGPRLRSIGWSGRQRRTWLLLVATTAFLLLESEHRPLLTIRGAGVEPAALGAVQVRAELMAAGYCGDVRGLFSARSDLRWGRELDRLGPHTGLRVGTLRGTASLAAEGGAAERAAILKIRDIGGLLASRRAFGGVAERLRERQRGIGGSKWRIRERLRAPLQPFRGPRGRALLRAPRRARCSPLAGAAIS